MFSFHKPKVYRSSTGCCICKAKSSSSRFTDSKKYEEDFVDCFQLPEKRCGEVCNACVLLVKRWKKLPEGNGRNWRHVVDARAGPGTKSMTKFKSRNHNRPSAKRKSTDDDLEEGPVLRKKKPRKLRGRSPTLCDGDEEGDETTPESSRSPTPSEEEIPHKRLTPTSGFVDITVWKRSKSCCGLVYLGPWGMTMINPRQLKMCSGGPGGGGHEGVPGGKGGPGGGGSGAPNLASKPPYSDNSSDSGYDESSNQSICHPLPTN